MPASLIASDTLGASGGALVEALIRRQGDPKVLAKGGCGRSSRHYGKRSRAASLASRLGEGLSRHRGIGPQRISGKPGKGNRWLRECVIECLLIAEPRGTFYAMADVGALGEDSFEIARRLLFEQRVAVAPGETFGPAGTGTVRLSLASPPEVVAEAIGRIARAVRGAAVTFR